MAGKKGQEAPEAVEDALDVESPQDGLEGAPEAPDGPPEATPEPEEPEQQAHIDPLSLDLGPGVPSDVRDAIAVELATEYPDSPVGHSVTLDVYGG